MSILRELLEEYTTNVDHKRVWKGYNKAIKELSGNLYKSNHHYLYEVIQNADDNEYLEGTIPSLKISLEKITIFNKLINVLIIENNEIGFNVDNIEAICSIGGSTKNYDQIGEKGIGFKSVFRLTDCPYVFSGKFRFKLPEKFPNDEYIGFITPIEIGKNEIVLPKHIDDKKNTVIVLPINESKIKLEKIITQLEEQLKDYTLFFLKKIKKIELKINLPSKRKTREIICSQKDNIRKLIIQNDGNLKERNFYVVNFNIKFPDKIIPEKRFGKFECQIEIGIPIDHTIQNGVLFAYLPVLENTNLPFFINSDFLLTSSREEVLVDLEWNKWIRDHISSAYVNAFMNFISSSKFSLEEKINAYKSIPNYELSNDFLNLIIADIYKRLSNEEFMIPFGYEQNHRLLSKNQCLYSSKELLKLVEKSSNIPEAIKNEELNLIHSKIIAILPTSKLTNLGFSSLELSKFKKYFLVSSDWMIGNSDSWFVSLFLYLNQNRFAYEKFNEFNIIPVDDNNSKLFCAQDTPLFIELKDGSLNKKTIKKIPLEYHPKVFRKSILDALIIAKDESIKSWISDSLSIISFDKENYTQRLYEIFRKDFRNLNSKQFIAISEVIFEIYPEIITKQKDYFPLLQANNNVSLSEDTTIVVAESYDEENGWQHLYSIDERKHFNTIHTDYSIEFINAFIKEKRIQEFPSFPSRDCGYSYLQEPFTNEGKEILRILEDKSSIQSRYQIKLTEFYLPKVLQNFEPSIKLSSVLLKFCKSIHTSRWGYKNIYKGLYNKGVYFNRSLHEITSQSAVFNFLKNTPWILTNNNTFRKPVEVFILSSTNRSILGEVFPNIDEIYTNEILKSLGVKTEISTKILFNALIRFSKSKDTKPIIINSLYEKLSQNIEELKNLISTIAPDSKLIFADGNWYSAEECVWDGIQNESNKNNEVVLRAFYPNTFEKMFEVFGVSKTYDIAYFIEEWNLIIETYDVNTDRLDWIYKNVKSKLFKLNETLEQHLSNSDYSKDIKELRTKDFIYSSNRHSFYDYYRIYFNDNSTYFEIFEDDIPFAYIPKNDGFITWKKFFNDLDVQNISELVTTSLEERITDIFEQQNNKNYLTNGAILLITGFIKTKYREEYESLLEKQFVQKLIDLEEFESEDNFDVNYTFQDSFDGFRSFTRSPESSYYLDSKTDDFKLFYSKNADKDDIAKEIFLLLKKEIPNLEDCTSKIENYLGLTNYEKRLKKEGYSLPEEVEALLNSYTIPLENSKAKVDLDEEIIDVDTLPESPTHEVKVPIPPKNPIVKSINNDDEREAVLINQIGHTGKYSYKWFNLLLDLENLMDTKGNGKSNGLSISFSDFTIENEKYVVLKNSTRPIPRSIEDQEDIMVNFSLNNGESIIIRFTSASVKDFSVHLRCNENEKEKLNEILSVDVNEIRLEISSAIRINEKLKKAFLDLKFKDSLCLKSDLIKKNIKFIFGPPGTGKTTTIASQISQKINENKEHKILVLTPTNKAADVLTLKLIEKNKEKSDDWIWRFVTTHDDRIEKEELLYQRNSNIQDSKKVCVISTIARYSYDGFEQDKLNKINWDVIVIDEASMIPIAQIIYALNANLKNRPEFLIAGDPFQIEPIVKAYEWKNENIYEMVQLKSFSKPTTEPIKFDVTCLNTQYRSIPSIGNLFSKYMYDGKINHHRTKESQRKLNLDFLEVKDINFIQFPTKETTLFKPKSVGSSNVHLYSALFTYEFLTVFSQHLKIEENQLKWSVGVICPYKQQADIVNKLWGNRSNDSENLSVSIGTVHGFQGDECDIIIALYNPPAGGMIRYTEDVFVNRKNIMNVAISRAKDYLFVLMPDENYDFKTSLNELNKIENIAKRNVESTMNFHSDEIEESIFSIPNFIEKNTFVSVHQTTNVYTKSTFKYDIRIDEDNVDIQMN